MKVYISVDIEGIAGITHWDEAEKNHPDYPEFRKIMTQEAVAAIEGAKAAGAKQIYVKDAHDSGRNLILEMLPEEVTIIREWSKHPLSMLQELDKTFDAIFMVGYHAPAGSEGNALAHTLTLKTQRIEINGRQTSEFYLHALAAASLGVPVTLVTGDAALMDEVKATNATIGRVAIKRGVGRSTISMTPAASVKAIHKAAQAALGGDLKKRLIKLPNNFDVVLTYSDPVTAYQMAQYPGAKHLGDRKVGFKTKDIIEVLRLFKFVA